MNRLILIGNGFDLAHGLKTSYKDFIEYLWKGIFEEINLDKRFRFTDNNKLIEIEIYSEDKTVESKINEYLEYYNLTRLQNVVTNPTTENIKNVIAIIKQIGLSYINKFFKIISQNYINKNWSDIEADYYRELLRVKDNQKDIYELNKQFNQIKELLRGYLKSLSKARIIEKIKRQIYSPILYRDINLKHREIYFDEIFNKLKRLINSPELQQKIDNSYLDFDDRYFFSDCLDINNYIELDYGILKDYSKEDLKSYIDTNYFSFDFINGARPELIIPINSKIKYISPKRASDFYEESLALPKFLFAPNYYMYLNFNYTETEKFYRIRGYDPIFKEKIAPLINHIHGSLNDDSNHMIFGYGDEEADEYKELEKSDNRGLLDNVKSINYLEGTNYRDMESFIESDKFQIFIMGMSCGMADRTMLRKLFQHKNCVSVKPFYYQWKDDKGNIVGDNYTEIVQNISRCFSDKDLLRSVVVNKPNCEPLPQRNDR